MKPKKTFIFFDRDGTLIFDDRYYLGSQPNWKSLVKFCLKVPQGIKKLKKNLPKAKLFMITNQPAVAVNEKPLLTIKRAHEVSKYTLKLFESKGAKLDSYELCGHASHSYVKRKKGIFTFNKKLVCNCKCMKPKIGMIKNILGKHKVKIKGVSIYVVGDRATDVQTALNAGGFGILVPFNNEKITPKEKKSLKNKKNVYIAKSFSDAVDFIIKNESK